MKGNHLRAQHLPENQKYLHLSDISLGSAFKNLVPSKCLCGCLWSPSGSRMRNVNLCLSCAVLPVQIENSTPDSCNCIFNDGLSQLQYICILYYICNMQCRDTSVTTLLFTKLSILNKVHRNPTEQIFIQFLRWSYDTNSCEQFLFTAIDG